MSVEEGGAGRGIVMQALPVIGVIQRAWEDLPPLGELDSGGIVVV